jgi:hypothetical protein
MTTAKRKPPISVPSLRERITAALEELIEDASPAEQREILTGWRDVLDAALEERAEKIRSPSIPGPWIKMQMDARGHGNCPCRALIEAMKE